MKLRLLNASHQALCYLGHLAGLYGGGSDTHARAGARVDLDAYRHGLIDRFSNRHVRDTVARLCADSSDRIPKWLLPVLLANLASGGDILRAVTVVASWARYCEGVDEQGRPIVVVDPLRDRLVAAALRHDADPLAFVADRQLFGNLCGDERFVTTYLPVFASLHRRGARATLAELADRPG